MIAKVKPHQQGLQPANELALHHPYVFNVKVHAPTWGRTWGRGKSELPSYAWKQVQSTIEQATSSALSQHPPDSAEISPGWTF